MSILGKNNNMVTGTHSFHEFKKQASFFFKEKIKTARLALTDVTPAQLLTEDVINGNQWSPDTRTLKMISKAAFEVDDYWRIVEALHKRLVRFEIQNWRSSYNSLIVLENLLTHGPESVAEEFQSDKYVIGEMENFQLTDEKGFNWGLNVRKKSERILKLLGKGPLYKEERDRARKLTRGIEGFGSFCNRNSSAQGIMCESSLRTHGRCNSQFIRNGDDQEDQFSNLNHEGNADLVYFKKMGNFESSDNVSDAQMAEKFGARVSFKENTDSKKEVIAGDLDERNSTGEAKPLLGGRKDDGRTGVPVEEDHPFNDTEHLTSVSLLVDN